MTRMGHDSEWAAVIYQREARGADQLITNAIDAHGQGEQRRDDDEDGSGGTLVDVQLHGHPWGDGGILAHDQIPDDRLSVPPPCGAWFRT
jgi:hypothetical protein